MPTTETPPSEMSSAETSTPETSAPKASPPNRSDLSPPIRRALLSVSDKIDLAALAEALVRQGVEIISTGGTAAALRKALSTADAVVRDVSEVTGFPEMMDGRVKTLHPRVHGGLLMDRAAPEHIAAAQTEGIGAIDLVVVNLYPFEETVASGAPPATVIESIDVGGPAMIRAAAKNHAHVTVIVDPSDYAALIEQLDAGEGRVEGAFRRKMAVKAFAHTAAYDAAIAEWFLQREGEASPARISLAGQKYEEMRYGENPHQAASFYRLAGAEGRRPGVASAALRQGKALSYNNVNDADAAFELVAELDRFDAPACAIIKHANPCGAAIGATATEAYQRALACDPVSAFGGVVAFSRPLDGPTAQTVVEIFTEVVIAPDADEAALAVFAEKPALRLLTTTRLPDPTAPGRLVRSVAGGLLTQDRDARLVARSDLRIVTKRAPSPSEIDDMLLAWTIAKHVKSNAIVYAKNGAAVGIGAGQMSRVDSSRIAAEKARQAAEAAGLDAPLTKGSVVASDAFFPFADGLLTAAEAGASAVIQPGGSVRDAEVIAAADAAGLAMVFTGLRHFRH